MGRVRVVVALLAAALAGCGASLPPGATDSSTNSTSPAPSVAGVGHSLTLTGVGGLKVTVTVTSVIDPVKTGAVNPAPKGQRYVGVVMRLHDVGTAAYDNAPSSGASLLAAGGASATGEVLSSGDCSGDFSSGVVVDPGHTASGCVAFSLATGHAATRFRFSLESGLDDTGTWNVAGAGQPPPPPVPKVPKVTTSTSTSTSTGTRTTGTGTSTTGTGTTGTGTTGTGTTGTGTSTTGATAPAKCPSSIQLGPGTDCGLGLNTFRAVTRSYQQTHIDPSQVTVTDPGSGMSYQFLCSFGTTVDCITASGSAGPSVTFSQSSVTSYSGSTSSYTSTG